MLNLCRHSIYSYPARNIDILIFCKYFIPLAVKCYKNYLFYCIILKLGHFIILLFRLVWKCFFFLAYNIVLL